MKAKRQLIRTILTVGDTLIMYLSIFLSLLVRNQNLSFLKDHVLINHVIFFSFIQLLWLVFLFFLDFYEIPPIKDSFDYFTRLLIFVILCFMTGSIYFYLLPSGAVSPKTILFLDVLIIGTLITCFRFMVRVLVRQLDLFEELIFIGAQKEFNEIGPQSLDANNYKFIKIFSLEDILDPLFSKEELLKAQPDLIVLSNSLYNDKELADRIFNHLPLGLNYISFSDFYEDIYRKIPIDYVNEMWLLNRMGQKLNFSEFIKRIFDIIFSSIGLIITILIFPLMALLIKITSSGPVLYQQQRVGARGRIFVLLKFRTMKSNAEENGPQWAEKKTLELRRWENSYATRISMNSLNSSMF